MPEIPSLLTLSVPLTASGLVRGDGYYDNAPRLPWGWGWKR